MSGVPVPDKRNSADSLENFARQIEEMFRFGKDQGPLALQRKVCRLLASSDPKVAATMTAKWVEWRYGKAKETLKVEGAITHTHDHYEHATDEQLRAAEESINALIESASDAGSNQR